MRRPIPEGIANQLLGGSRKTSGRLIQKNADTARSKQTGNGFGASLSPPCILHAPSRNLEADRDSPDFTRKIARPVLHPAADGGIIEIFSAAFT